ncbi:O-antigen ligase family protein, partial [Candidatus Curtissbacteria bacterium]|nr:O-antigen ligase family protein [Candidatus Curtissbacteria bacterium]
MTGKLTSTCWQKEFDPQLRIFSTLGQPNWLASYLVIVLPLSVAFALINIRQLPKVLFGATTLILFTALVMTNSRAGFLGGAIALILFLILLLQRFESVKQNIKVLITLGLGFSLITAVFGTTLISRIGEAISRSQTSDIASLIPGISDNQIQPASPTLSPPPSTGGTESSIIRLIVWKGAIEIFKHWPALGSGPETFAYSYYKFRPIEHNQT